MANKQNEQFIQHLPKPKTPAFTTYGWIPTTKAIREVGPKYFSSNEGGIFKPVNAGLYYLLMSLPEKEWKNTGIHSLCFGEPAAVRYARWDIINGWTDLPVECFY